MGAGQVPPALRDADPARSGDIAVCKQHLGLQGERFALKGECFDTDEGPAVVSFLTELQAEILGEQPPRLECERKETGEL